MSISLKYFEGSAHKWWIGYKYTERVSFMYTWDEVNEGLIERFQPLYKAKLTRVKLSTWKQIKYGRNHVPVTATI